MGGNCIYEVNSSVIRKDNIKFSCQGKIKIKNSVRNKLSENVKTEMKTYHFTS